MVEFNQLDPIEIQSKSTKSVLIKFLFKFGQIGPCLNLIESVLVKIRMIRPWSKFSRLWLSQPLLKFGWAELDENLAETIPIGICSNLIESGMNEIYRIWLTRLSCCWNLAKLDQDDPNWNSTKFGRVRLDKDWAKFGWVGPNRNLADSVMTKI